MNTYIQLLAQELLRRFGRDMSKVAVVFPNKRASLFLNQELARQAAIMNLEDAEAQGNEAAGVNASPIWAPAYITISDLFRRHSSLHVADQILLVCRLYDVFRRCTGIETETLDHFYNWGLLMLADFDDLDKNMADAERVFQLLAEHHDFDDDSYLTDSQRQALQQFFKTFNDGHTSFLREKFLHLWSKLFDIYTTFREELRRDSLAYEGMLYRDVCENLPDDFQYQTYCFVGFNMLQQVEQNLFSHLQREGRALFFWDYDDYYLQNSHEAGHFIGEYLKRFPDAMPHDCRHDNLVASKQHVTFISAPTENLQARYVHDWLLENDRWKGGSRTAIVMSDESLLQTIIRSLPDEVSLVNITTGYPLQQSPVVSLLQYLIEMQTDGRIPGTDKYNVRYVNAVLRHPYVHILTPQAASLAAHLSDTKNYYPSRQQLTSAPATAPVAATIPLAATVLETATIPEAATVPEELSSGSLSLLFQDLDTLTAIDGSMPNFNTRITLWLQSIIQGIARQRDQLSQLDSEALFRTYQILQRIFSLTSDGTLAVDITTYRRLLLQIINTTTVPYHGEPLAGIQIMGVLETRCLDFDHVLLLSCNEGNMPKGVNDSSFIPHSVRKAYGMTTVEHKVGIYSYYFHRLLQRASDVSIAYNTSTEGLNSGEMSRFMLQLMVESGLPIRRVALRTGQDSITASPQPIVKDDATMRLLRSRLLYDAQAEEHHAVSPSSLSAYLRCQLRYYYTYVMGLREDDEDIEEMDNRTFGLIFHKAADNAYHAIADGQGVVYADAIAHVLKDKGALARYVDDAFCTELFHLDPAQKAFRPQYSGLHLINRRVILRLLRDLLEYDAKSAPFRIILTEKYVSTIINIPLTVNELTEQARVKVGGIIDRLDVTLNERQPKAIRVIDYKTGNFDTTKKKLPGVDAIFNPDNLKNHSDYFLQALLYSYIIRHSARYNSEQLPVQPHLTFVQKLRTDGYTSLLSLGDVPISDILPLEQDYLQQLQQLIAEILNPSVPFSPTASADSCTRCPFCKMCHA